MRIAEVFHSIQGEGRFAGTPSVFVRTSGCNLRCWFCDTAYSSWEPEGEQRAWEEVLRQVRGYDCEHVVVTGGEPLLQADVVPLTQSLRAQGHFVTIETAGTVYLAAAADLMSISPKRPNSTPGAEHPGPADLQTPLSPGELAEWGERHERNRDHRDVVARLIGEYQYQLKFVIDGPEDLDDVECYVSQIDRIDAGNVWLMPQAVTAEQLHEKRAWLEREAERRGYRVSSRLHIEMFGNVRGT